MATVTVNLTAFSSNSDLIWWDSNVSIGSIFAANNLTQTIENVRIYANGSIRIFITGANNDFTDAFETSGRIIFRASDGKSLEVMIANADTTEFYNWTPTNSAEVIAFQTHIRGLALADRNVTLRLTDDAPSEDGPWSALLTHATADGLWSALLGALTTDGPWSTINADLVTQDSPWSAIVRGPEAVSVDGPWSSLRTTSTTATVTVPNTNWVQATPNIWFWNPSIYRDHISLGFELSVGKATNLYLGAMGFSSINGGSFSLNLSDGSSDASGAGPDFSDDMEQTGTIRFVASNGSELVLTTTGGDSSEPYNWTPSNATQYRAFSSTLIGLADKSLTITFDFEEETRDGSWSPLLGNLTQNGPWSELNADLVTQDSLWSPFISAVTVNGPWSTLLGNLTEDGLWSGLSGTVTATGDWSFLTVTTINSLWSSLVSVGESVDGAWSEIAAGLETTNGEWSDPKDSFVVIQIDRLATPDMPSDLDDGAGIGRFTVDFEWEGEPTHVALYQLRSRWITRSDGRVSPAPPKDEAELWMSAVGMWADQGDFEYRDTIILGLDMALSGNVMIDDHLLIESRFAGRSIWVMARLEVDPTIKVPP